MRNTDKFLITIVVGALVLVVATFAVALRRPEPAYRPDNSPENVVFNYLLALQREDFARAYRYISSDLDDYPRDVDEFETELQGYGAVYRRGGSVSMSIVGVEVRGADAEVQVRETVYFRGGLFDSGQSSRTFQVELALQEGAWKIMQSEGYFAWCWRMPDGCRQDIPLPRPVLPEE